MSFNLKVKKASSDRSTFNLSFPHLQTAEFMENNVVFSKYTVPSDNFSIDPAFEARCSALQNPSFIDTKYYVRCFYVPHSVVWHRFDDWVNGNPTYITGVLNSQDCPTISDSSLTSLFINDTSLATQLNIYTGSEWQNYIEGGDRSHAFDFAIYVSPNYTTYKLTNKGRYIYKLLRSLGYNFVWTVQNDESTTYNALALLSYFRIFLDYFIPSVKVLSSACNKLCSYYYNVGGDLYQDPTMIKDCFSEIYHCFYPSSYFTSSWQTPVQPLTNGGSNLQTLTQLSDAFNPIMNYAVGAQGTTGGISEVMPDGGFLLGAKSSQNPWIQRNVQRVVDWLTRSRFVGSEQLLNILSRFGVKPKTPLAHTARFIGSYVQDLSVQDINSTTNNFDELTQTGAKLGEYAGKMFTQAQDKAHFEVNSDDYGCIIITSMIAPGDIYYWQGVEREILNDKPMQFYQPEFDSVGFELLSSRELMSGFYMPGTEQLTGDQGIGFVPRSSHYKIPFAKVSGDFAVPSLNELMDSYHHFRSIYKYGRYKDAGGTIHYNVLVPNTGNKDDINGTELTSAQQYSAQSSLLTTAYDKNQFNRIFNVMDDGTDHIYTMYYFHVTANRPMRSIADSLITLDGDNEKIDVNKSTIDN